MKQMKTSVQKYVEKLKDLTRQLETQPSDKSLRAWFLNDSNNKRLERAEITNATGTFEELVARALKMEISKKKHKKTSTDDSESSASTSSEESLELSNSDRKKKYKAGRRKSCRRNSSESSDSEEDDKRKSRAGKKRANKKPSHDKMLELLTKKIEELTTQRV